MHRAEGESQICIASKSLVTEGENVSSLLIFTCFPVVVTSVLQHDHKLKGVTLKVEPYLDSRLTNDDQHFEVLFF